MKTNVFVKPDEQRELVHSVVAKKGRMKSNMKKLLVIVMALMPSLSICSFAQEGGGTLPDDIPIGTDYPSTNPRPRGDDGGYDDGGDDDGNYGEPLINLHNGGTIPRSGDHQGEPIAIKGSTPRPRSVAETPYCYHYEGVVYIEADNTITHINASVTRYADNQVWSNAASTNTLSINASDASGTYLLELTLSDGCTYIGEYTIE